MKKLLISTALIGLIGFAGIQAVSARGGYNNYGYCGNYGNGYSALTEKDSEAIKKFRTETATVRKEIVVKRSELDALMRQDNPDEKKAAKLTGEIYDLQTRFAENAEDAGVENFVGDHRGNGMMRGNGWQRGGHMMDW